ncbi:Asparaginase [Moraxella caviae]|uniref:asparaginase domain-containing protein n=1 Tax=Moraxella caviae TaxID=34060 RepID=UPI00101B30C1|nr:asparaginase domain-containing protein [Moraxella caviae]VEW13702.1 Asparaginase [Moraxella caviae]
MHTPQTTHLIYVGGTFGSHGTPLSPLLPTCFCPSYKASLPHALPTSARTSCPTTSSRQQRTHAQRFVALYETLLTAYQTGARRFVIITGTDSLSYLAAFMAAAFADCHDITLIITGSMQPLLIADEVELQINEQSDAWANISGAIAVAQAAISGVFVQFANKPYWQKHPKIDSQVFDAFAGMPLPQASTQTLANFTVRLGKPSA